MRRYIDAYKIPRHGKRGGECYWQEIEQLPNADVVEVVRCKDCRWYERDIFDREAGVCFNPNKCTKTLGFEVLNEDYCSYGEREDNG